MTERTTKKEVQACFEMLVKATGARIAERYSDVGGWELDHNATYGGYVIHEISNLSGGVCEPFGSRRRSGRDFCDACRFAVAALQVLDQRLVSWEGTL